MVADYRGLLTRQTAEARGILRELLVDRVVYAPREGRVDFKARCTHLARESHAPSLQALQLGHQGLESAAE
jgi:hypothetical protein